MTPAAAAAPGRGACTGGPVRGTLPRVHLRVSTNQDEEGTMRLHRRLVAGTATALLALGLAACEVDEGAMDNFEDPGVEEEGGEL